MKKFNFILLILILLSSSINAQEVHNKTGYFSRVYAREHVNDMPRGFYMLIEADGTITPMSFSSYSTQNTGALSPWNFNPKTFLGKVISIDFKGYSEKNNNEYPIADTNGNLVYTPLFRVTHITSISETSGNITVPSEFQYPQPNTLLIPHDITVTPQTYTDKTTSATVQLTTYVTGAGTEVSPYTSADGSAGLKQAITALSNGGTIEVPSGIYKVTTKNISFPRFVSLLGTGSTKPLFKLTKNRSWVLRGSNTMDNINVNCSSITSYYNDIILIANNARDIIVKNSEFVGAYSVTPVTYEEQGSGVCFRMSSHISNITFQNNVFTNLMRGIVTKGQRNQHNITIRDNTFQGANHWHISFDQTSNISNILVTNNQFLDFTHFGIAFARINGVIIRGNTFYSRNLLGFNTYSRAIHLEEHCQNFVIEDNNIDVILRHRDSSDPNTKIRTSGIAISDSRFVVVKNNTVLNSNVLLDGAYSDLDEKIIIDNNQIENGGIQIRDAMKRVTVSNNTITNPPEEAFEFISNKPRLYPFGWHLIENNTIKDMDNTNAFYFGAQIQETTIRNNIFQGCNQTTSDIRLLTPSTNLTIENNDFYGLIAQDAFTVRNLPAVNSLSQYKSSNTFDSDCNPSLSFDTPQNRLKKKTNIYPNPIESGAILNVSNIDLLKELNIEIYMLNGTLIYKGTSNKIDTKGFALGVYILKVKSGNSQETHKLIIK